MSRDRDEFRIGDRVVFAGKPGVIEDFPGYCAKIRFDDGSLADVNMDDAIAYRKIRREQEMDGKKPEDDLSLSGQLRQLGQRISDIGQRLEDSQVEDGDPPFEIPRADLAAMSEASKLLHGWCEQLKPVE